jgi:hypothetical protein
VSPSKEREAVDIDAGGRDRHTRVVPLVERHQARLAMSERVYSRLAVHEDAHVAGESQRLRRPVGEERVDLQLKGTVRVEPGNALKLAQLALETTGKVTYVWFRVAP